jgi:hypothetical protein
MKLFGPLSRTVALVGLLIATPMVAAPAYAAKADVDLLKSYIGEWKGRGTLVGAESESVVCRLSLSEGNSDKVNYSGRCSLAGTSLSVNGTLAYNDGKKQYEAAMTSNVTFSGLAIGKKQGDGIVFNLKERDTDEEGNDMTITAAITLKASKIDVDFSVLFNASGDMLKASVPFNK